MVSPPLPSVPTLPWPHGRGARIGRRGMAKGIRVKTSSFTRHHVNINMCRSKSVGTYTNSILAHQEVAHDGYDEALLLDVDGYVAEGAGENIFIVKKGKLYTPDLTSCLEGISRDTIITLAKELGIELIEKRITRDEVYTADEAFFTAPRPRSPRSANWTTAPSASVRAARLPPNCNRLSLIVSQASTRSTPIG